MVFETEESTPTHRSQERRLLDYLQRMSRSLEGRMAVHLHLSRLRAYHKREFHLRIAVSAFESQVGNQGGQLFSLGNADIFYVYSDVPPPVLETAIMKVRHLFSEDPLCQGDDVEDLAMFSSWYNLAAQFDDVMALVQRLVRDAERRAIAGTGAEAGGTDKPKNRRRLDPRQLSKLEQFLRKADLNTLIRRQPVCAVAKTNQRPRAIFREYYMSISDLQETVLSGIDLLADQWLFQHLTETLDQQMLQILTRRQDDRITKSFSLNLNVGTILSPDFVSFESNLKTVARGTVVIELQAINVFGDMSGYTFARDFLRERDFRVCLDGLNYQTLAFIDRERLGPDLMKLQWSPVMIEDLSSRRLHEMRVRIRSAGRARVILCRCDSIDAIYFGLTLGITMFQGRYVDRMLREMPPDPPAKKAN